MLLGFLLLGITMNLVVGNQAVVKLVKVLPRLHILAIDSSDGLEHLVPPPAFTDSQPDCTLSRRLGSCLEDFLVLFDFRD